MNFTFREPEAFLGVARPETFTRAARALTRSQGAPAVRFFAR